MSIKRIFCGDISCGTCGQSSGSTSSLERAEPPQVQCDECQHQIEHHKHQPEEGQNHKLYGQVVEDNQTLSKTRKESYEKIFENFYQHYLYLEMELSRKLEHSINKQKFRKICCDLYQKSFFKCRGVIQDVFQNSLIEITKLSNEEEESGEVKQINAKAAYKYLLIHCETKLDTLDKSPIVNEVLTSLSVDDNSKLREKAEEAVDICWKMQTVLPPMFLCQPNVYNEEWHICHARSWHDPPGELICCMYSAGGIVAHKGLVGSEPKTVLNTHQSTNEDVFFINKQEFQKIYCDLYQKSFFKCRDAIQDVFHNSLIEITKLSNEEEDSGEVNIGRQRSLINAKAAYEYLLIHCENKLNKKFDKVAIANDVLALLSVDDNILKELRKEAEKAVDICWKMLTVSPPMFLCQPKVYNEEWHKCHAGSWHDPPGELIYYRPVLMYSAGGIVAHKGYVGSKPNTVLHQSTNEDVSSPMPNPDQFLSHTTCSAYGNDNLTDGDDHCTSCYKNPGDRNRQEKQLEKMKVTDHHESLHKIKICSSCKNKIQLNEFGKLIFVMEVKYYHQRCFTCCKCNTDKMNADFVVLCDGSIIWCGECVRNCHFCKQTLSGKKLLWKSKLACEVCMYQRQKGQDLQLLLIEHTRNPQDISVYHWRHTCTCNCSNTLETSV